MIYTLGANVFVSAALTIDVHHADSSALLQALRGRSDQLYCPSLLLVETVAAVARVTSNSALAQRQINLIPQFPGMKLVSLTLSRARRAARLAALHRLRGADAVYVAVATEYGATLITWDMEMLLRGASVVTTMTPTDWLSSPPP